MIFDSCDLQEVDPGQSSYEQTHAGLQHKRPRHKGLRWNHWHHFLFCQQAEDLGGSGDSMRAHMLYMTISVIQYVKEWTSRRSPSWFPECQTASEHLSTRWRRTRRAICRELKVTQKVTDQTDVLRGRDWSPTNVIFSWNILVSGKWLQERNKSALICNSVHFSHNLTLSSHPAADLLKGRGCEETMWHRYRN